MHSNSRELLLPATLKGGAVAHAVAECTYVGIDFGTSTTVVSVIAATPDGRWSPRTLQLEQSDVQGIFTEQPLVNSVLAWHQDKLIFGLPAYDLKARLSPGRDYFSSFKMELGVSVPAYPRTKLPRSARLPYAIETAADATGVFFKLLLPAIKKAVQKEHLPARLRFAVSVPASFQSAQRHELLECLRGSGIEAAEGCLIDEPNAAFISFLKQCNSDEDEARTYKELLARISSAHGANILIYDFGAGTCDVSILTVSVDSREGVRSTNRSISRFTALGGDNIDREIARRVLVPQMEGVPLEEMSNAFIEQHALPLLMYTAEKLKIAMLTWIAKMGYYSLGQLQFVDHRVTERDTLVYSVPAKNIKITIPEPALEMSDFLKIMELFVGESPEPAFDVCAPIEDALQKAKMEADDLDAVLFIGGSCENPLVRQRIREMMPPKVHAVVPRDLREHVSLGAAIHSFGYHAFGFDFVTPIVSEDIYVLTRGMHLAPLILASTPVPTGEKRADFLVPEKNQRLIKIPICRGSTDVILGILTLTPGTNAPFKEGEPVTLTAAISKDKELKITALAAGRPAVTQILSPLAQHRLTPDDELYLKAKCAYNEAMLQYGPKNLPRDVILKLARACARCGRSAEAAELYEQFYNLYQDASVLNSITYQYDRAGKASKRRRWAKFAAEKDPTAVNLYNYAIEFEDSKEEARWLRRALEIDPDYNLVLVTLGRLLNVMHEDGTPLLKRAFKNLRQEFLEGSISYADVKRLLGLAETFGDRQMAEACRDFLKNRENSYTPADSSSGFDERQLLEAVREPRLEDKSRG